MLTYLPTYLPFKESLVISLQLYCRQCSSQYDSIVEALKAGSKAASVTELNVGTEQCDQMARLIFQYFGHLQH